jgi:hypothetical protein
MNEYREKYCLGTEIPQTWNDMRKTASRLSSRRIIILSFY